MFNLGTLMKGIGLGAGFMYFFDPDRGKRRRALVRDQINGTMHDVEHFLDTACRDMSNRVSGMVAECESLLIHDTAPDRVVAERVRSKMGRYVSHPGAIDVTAENGRVILSGPILQDEVDDFLSAVSSVRGVTGVENRLDVHHDRGNISSLQGGTDRPGQRSELMQENWSPATRLLVGGTGLGLMFNCLARRTPGAVLLGTLGFGMFLRGTSNLGVRRLTGVGAGRRAITMQKTMQIGAPIERVFEFVSDFEKCSRFVQNVREVHNLGDGRIRFTVQGPGDGATFQFEEAVTELVPNERLSWRSLPGSPVEYEGTVHFERESDDSTRIHVQMGYNPPLGAAGHAVAALFGMDPEHQMEQALMRVKTFLETGNPPHDAAPLPQEQAGG